MQAAASAIDDVDVSALVDFDIVVWITPWQRPAPSEQSLSVLSVAAGM